MGWNTSTIPHELNRCIDPSFVHKASSNRKGALRIVRAAPGVGLVGNGRSSASRNVASDSAVRIDEGVPVSGQLHGSTPVAGIQAQ